MNKLKRLFICLGALFGVTCLSSCICANTEEPISAKTSTQIKYENDTIDNAETWCITTQDIEDDRSIAAAKAKELDFFRTNDNKAPSIDFYIYRTDMSVTSVSLIFSYDNYIGKTETSGIANMSSTAKSTKFTIELSGSADYGNGDTCNFTLTATDNLKHSYDYSVIVHNPSTSVWSTIQDLLNSASAITVIATACATVLIRVGLKIFRFGADYKNNYMSVKDGDKFKDEIRAEIRTSKTDMQDSILKICMREISNETKPLKDITSLADNLKTSSAVVNAQIDTMKNKYNEIEKLSNTVTNLEKTVHSIQFGETNNIERRSGK